MATKNVTFDPDAGVPKGVNLTMYGGSDFEVNLVVNTTSNAAFDLTNYSGSAAMSKSVAVGATLGITSSFTVGFTSAYDGKLKISLGAVNTTSNTAFDLTNYSGSAAMSKSVAVGATLGITSSFTVGFTSAYDGKLKISLGAVNTRATAEGRYVYDVLLKHEVGGGSTVHPLISGNILVVNPVSSAP